jgi:uncharacterized protein YdeI (YjbR/CyaY-like superfamily)
MDKENNWQRELQILKRLISQSGLEVSVKWGTEVFTHQGKNVVSCGGFKHFFSLWFYNGVFLKDPYQVLVTASEGKTKALRQWRFTSEADIDEARILEYLREAVQNEEEGRVWKAQPAQMPDLPSALSEMFALDPDLQTAFEKLPAYKQRDYMEYISSASREATTKARLNKIIPMVLRGEGLHDKYRKSK